jgi:hypothetical protein
MAEDRSTTIVEGALREWGFNVEPIPEVHTERSPDLRATANDEVYLIEVKEKRADELQLRKAEEAYSRNEQVLITHELTPRPTIDSIVRTAVSQITSHPEAGATFHILWYAATGWHAAVYFEQIQATLYGSVTLIDRDEPTWLRTCLFFGESAFFRSRLHLDAAVITCGQNGQLCLNPYSPRVDKLRASYLAGCFSGGVIDPPQLEAAGQVVIANCIADRGDSDAVLKFLETKVGRRLTTMTFRQASVSFTLPEP